MYVRALALFVYNTQFAEQVRQTGVQCRPQHVHLSLGETSNQMVVMWATNGTCDTHVSYGASPWQLDQHAEGTSKTLADSNKDGLHMIHRVLIANLQASTTYYYRPTSNNIS
nr:hypothetical protein BaRGS_004688 [Batillaria attramentaria]